MHFLIAKSSAVFMVRIGLNGFPGSYNIFSLRAELFPLDNPLAPGSTGRLSGFGERGSEGGASRRERTGGDGDEGCGRTGKGKKSETEKGSEREIYKGNKNTIGEMSDVHRGRERTGH